MPENIGLFIYIWMWLDKKAIFLSNVEVLFQ
jgi:hypothetical protein